MPTQLYDKLSVWCHYENVLRSEGYPFLSRFGKPWLEDKGFVHTGPAKVTEEDVDDSDGDMYSGIRQKPENRLAGRS